MEIFLIKAFLWSYGVFAVLFLAVNIHAALTD